MSSSLTTKNYVNLAAFVANIAITYGVGTAGWGGLPDNAELSEKYQTLITPIGWAFAIWGPIFISEAIFTVAQMLPSYRSDPMVLDGVSWWFALACAAQCAWTIAFSTETLTLSFVFMAAILFFLAMLLRSQYQLTQQSVGKFWLLQFPFQLHAGWIVAATNVNLSVLFVAKELNTEVVNSATQITVGILSLAAVVAIALYLLFVLEKRHTVSAGVQAWALFGIAAQLSKPLDKTVAEFGQLPLDGIAGAASTAGTFIAVLVGISALLSLYSAVSGKDSVSDEDRERGLKLNRTLSAPLTGVTTV